MFTVRFEGYPTNGVRIFFAANREPLAQARVVQYVMVSGLDVGVDAKFSRIGLLKGIEPNINMGLEKTTMIDVEVIYKSLEEFVTRHTQLYVNRLKKDGLVPLSTSIKYVIFNTKTQEYIDVPRIAIERELEQLNVPIALIKAA